jgi:hypothetical protein
MVLCSIVGIWRGIKGKKLAECFQYLPWRIRFAYKPGSRWKFGFGWNIQTRSHNQMNRRPAIPYRMGQLQSVERTGHGDIGENSPDVIAGVQYLERNIGIPGLQNPIASVFQQLNGTHANERFVFDNQNNDLIQGLAQFSKKIRTGKQESSRSAQRDNARRGTSGTGRSLFRNYFG